MRVQELGYHFQVNDFYSPLNDCRFLRENTDLWGRTGEESADIDWNRAGQLETAEIVGRYVEELRDVPQTHGPDKIEYCWQNPFWNSSDALVQYGLLRHLRPRRIVEVGCGYSSLLMKRALEANGGECEVTQIEPYPNRAIFNLFPGEWRHHEVILQRAPFEPFEALKSGDICFYDGSHCSKIASDVNWFFFEILPRLASGVVIHLHDIFLPGDYPNPWIFEAGQTWNEQYVLQAFLMNNPKYRIIMANRYLWLRQPAELDALYKGIQPSYGCSFWMEKL